jgi:pyruvate,water dikinase
MTVKTSPVTYIRWFEEISAEDIPFVGGKNASLGEMYQALTPQGVKIPNGFAITAEAYRYFLREAKLDSTIHEILRDLDTNDLDNLRQRGRQVRQAILGSALPSDLENLIIIAYQELSEDLTGPADVAVRSSATAEDLPDASFAGQQETYLNVQGDLSLLEFDHFQIALSIGVQQMVRSDLAAAGVLFTIDTETGFPDVVLINASYGLGENVVQGTVKSGEARWSKMCRSHLRTEAILPLLMKKFWLLPDGVVLSRITTRPKKAVPVPWTSNGQRMGKPGICSLCKPDPKPFNQEKTPMCWKPITSSSGDRSLFKGGVWGKKLGRDPFG